MLRVLVPKEAIRLGFVLALAVAAAASCGADEHGDRPSSSAGGTAGAGAGAAGAGGASDEPTTRYELAGVVQKGPFITGTFIVVAELDSLTVPTGRTFQTTIVDDAGSFQLRGVTLASPLVRLTADGFYFDEVAGELSPSRIELAALADVTETSSINVNLLSTLEQGRVEYLLSEQGRSFSEAKAQAQREVLAVFLIESETISTSEHLDMAAGDEGSAILVAASVLLQGFRTPAELTELLSRINTDLRTDGALQSASSGSALMNAAARVDLEIVRSNLEQRYADLGVDATLGPFEPYVEYFRTHAPYVVTDAIAYPASGSYGANLLFPEETELDYDYEQQEGMLLLVEGTFSLRASLPRGAALTVRIRPTSPNGPPDRPGLSVSTSFCDWEIDVPGEPTTGLSVSGEGEYDCRIQTYGHDPLSVAVNYFEDGSETPTLSRTVTLQRPAGGVGGAGSAGDGASGSAGSP